MCAATAHMPLPIAMEGREASFVCLRMLTTGIRPLVRGALLVAACSAACAAPPRKETSQPKHDARPSDSCVGKWTVMTSGQEDMPTELTWDVSKTARGESLR